MTEISHEPDVVNGERVTKERPPVESFDFPVTGVPKSETGNTYPKPVTLDEEARRELPLIDSDFVTKVLPNDPSYEGDTLKVIGKDGPVFAYHQQTPDQIQKDPGLVTFTRVADSEADYLNGVRYPVTKTAPETSEVPQKKSLITKLKKFFS
ncbi:hypothetical protein KBD68_02275 [Candidatus Woesebacteria bacterium]|nr:hypothetical protein [Candidatus Woesebacteria bacterium]